MDNFINDLKPLDEKSINRVGTEVGSFEDFGRRQHETVYDCVNRFKQQERALKALGVPLYPEVLRARKLLRAVKLSETGCQNVLSSVGNRYEFILLADALQTLCPKGASIGSRTVAPAAPAKANPGNTAPAAKKFNRPWKALATEDSNAAAQNPGDDVEVPPEPEGLPGEEDAEPPNPDDPEVDPDADLDDVMEVLLTQTKSKLKGQLSARGWTPKGKAGGKGSRPSGGSKPPVGRPASSADMESRRKELY